MLQEVTEIYVDSPHVWDFMKKVGFELSPGMV